MVRLNDPRQQARHALIGERRRLGSVFHEGDSWDGAISGVPHQFDHRASIPSGIQKEDVGRGGFQYALGFWSDGDDTNYLHQ